MIYIYLIYGLSFFILWIVLLIYHMKLSRFPLARNLWMLGLFGLSHGTSDWLITLVAVERLQDPIFKIVSLVLLIVSFYFLIQFGLSTIVLKRKKIVLNILSVLLFAALIFIIITTNQKFLMGDIFSRYLLGIPGSLLAFYALWSQIADIKKMGRSVLVRDLRLASIGFLCYGFFSGLVVPEAAFFPASVLNYRLFTSEIGIPVELFRALSVLVIAFSLTRVLHVFEMEIESSMRRASLELEERVRARTEELDRLNEELKQRELQEKAILDNIPDMTWLKDRESRFVTVNAAFAASAGTTSEKLAGKTDFDIWPKDMAARYRADDKDVMNSGRRKRVEEPLVDKYGNVRWIETIKTPIYNEQGDVTGTAGIARDITDRKRYEEAIRAEESFRKAVESAILAGIVAVDLQKRQIYVNPGFCKMVGWTEAELIGAEPPFLYWPPEEVENINRAFQETLAGRGRPEGYELRFMRRSGERFDALVQNSLLKDGAQNTIGWLASVYDITGRKKAEKALRESENRYRAITETALDAIITIDQESTIILTNAAVETIFGYTKSELQGRSLTILMPERLKKAHRDAIKRYVATGKRHLPWSEMELPGLRKDGREIPLEMSYGDFTRNGKHFFTGIVRDISRRKEIENALRESEKRRQLIMDAVPAMISYLGPDQRYQFVNHRYEEWFQVPQMEIIGRDIKDLLGEGPYREIEKFVKLALEGERVSYERSLMRDNKKHYLHIDYVPHLGINREVLGFFSLITDITERKEIEERLQNANEKLSSVLNSITEAYYVLNSDWRLVEINKEASKILGPVDELVGRVYWEKFPQNIGTEIDRQYHIAAEERRPVHFEARSSINQRWYELHVYPRGETLEVYFRDITERKEVEQELEKARAEAQYQAYHDALTGLPNRFLFRDILQVEAAQARRNRKKLSVLFLDLDRFKEINDTLGHDAGDELLKQVAGRVKKSIRQSDTVARIGGDEFNVLLSDVLDADDVATTARKIINAFQNPYTIAGQELRVTTSIGIAIYPDDSKEIETILKFADMAMYHAKERGRNRYQFYDQVINTRNLERMQLENSLRKALEREELMIYYLPQIDTRSRKVISTEALLRWRHPELGLLSPAQFITVAEETGLIIPIGGWMLRTVVRQIKTWQQAGYRAIPVILNLSGRQFHQMDLADIAASLLREAGLEPNRIQFEISEETATRDAEFVRPQLSKLTERGFGFSIDDYGTGCLPLNHLKKLPIQKLKIDQSLIRDILTDPDDRTIVDAMIAMSHSLQIKAVAEGVETEEQLKLLLECNCDEIQGYVFSEPRPAEEFEKLISSR